jgi:hypothetical protein
MVDEDDEISTEDGKDNSNNEVDDRFDVDEGLDVSPDRKDSNNPIPETPSLPDGVFMEEQDAMDATDGLEFTADASPSPISTPAPTRSSNTTPSISSPTPPGSKTVEETSPIDIVEGSSEPEIPDTPKKISSVSRAVDIDTGPIPATPFSLAVRTSPPLVELEDEDDNFEELLRKRNRDRKEREDYHIAHIKVQMGRLEDALAAETKRRVDATTALDELARTQVHEMEDRVRGQLREENERLQRRLGALEERVQALEENWVIDSNNMIELVNNKAADLSKSISQIRDDQKMERKGRLKREGILLQQVEAHAKEAEERWTSEREDRVQRLKELEDQIIRNEARLALEQKRYEDRIEKEMTSLKDELEIEATERQTQDEEIVAALNRYTQQLQHSLSILSSD